MVPLLLVAISSVAVLQAFVVIFTVPGGHMYPTIAPGDSIVVRRRPYAGVADVQRGDVVTVVGSLGEGRIGIWRVIGLPGEDLRTAGSEVEISGVKALRQRQYEDAEGEIYREELGDAAYFVTVGSNCKAPDASLRVPPNHVYLLGDHRCASLDSRTFGPVPFESITGRLLFVF